MSTAMKAVLLAFALLLVAASALAGQERYGVRGSEPSMQTARTSDDGAVFGHVPDAIGAEDKLAEEPLAGAIVMPHNGLTNPSHGW
jgi:hypothetical protein